MKGAALRISYLILFNVVDNGGKMRDEKRHPLNGQERLSDILNYRISASQRAALEKIATETGCSLGDTARMLLNMGIEVRSFQSRGHNE
jgi:hypothetical protein